MKIVLEPFERGLIVGTLYACLEQGGLPKPRRKKIRKIIDACNEMDKEIAIILTPEKEV